MISEAIPCFTFLQPVFEGFCDERFAGLSRFPTVCLYKLASMLFHVDYFVILFSAVAHLYQHAATKLRCYRRFLHYSKFYMIRNYSKDVQLMTNLFAYSIQMQLKRKFVVDSHNKQFYCCFIAQEAGPYIIFQFFICCQHYLRFFTIGFEI